MRVISSADSFLGMRKQNQIDFLLLVLPNLRIHEFYFEQKQNLERYT